MLTHGLPMSTYLSMPGVSASTLRHMQRSPAYAMTPRPPSTEAQEWGTAVHTAILEPHTLDERYRIDPESPMGGYPSGWRNTNDYKARKAAVLAEPGVEGLLTAAERSNLYRIAENVARNDVGALMHSVDGLRESTLVVKDTEHGVTRKCRPDWYIPSARMIVDAKTAKDWRPGPFARAAHGYGYHMGAAYYLDTFALAGIEIDHYVYLVVASDAPYEVAAYTFDRDSIEQGRATYRRLLAQYAHCKRTGEWPGGTSKIEEIRIPEYAIDYHMEEML